MFIAAGKNRENNSLGDRSLACWALRFRNPSLAHTMSDSLEQRIHEAIANPKNLGEMQDADSVGTVGSPDCGDMLRLWVKFKDEDGRKVIDRATFQTFGCETAIAVASVATELIAGKTVEEALSMSSGDLAAPLGALPPMKIHCAQLVEGALRNALVPDSAAPAPLESPKPATTLFDQLSSGQNTGKQVKVVLKKPDVET
jgi:nitrogen fixation NifU-like protein